VPLKGLLKDETGYLETNISFCKGAESINTVKITVFNLLLDQLAVIALDHPPGDIDEALFESVLARFAAILQVQL
jgi:hypothetical protein